MRRHDPFSEWHLSRDVAAKLAELAPAHPEIEMAERVPIRLFARMVHMRDDLPPNSVAMNFPTSWPSWLGDHDAKRSEDEEMSDERA